MRRIARRLGLGVLGLAGGLTFGFGVLYLTTDLDRARFVHPEDAVTITDRNGTPLRHHRPGRTDRRWTALGDMSPHLVDAVVSVEDQRFFEHPGVDVRATARAAFSAVTPGNRLSGASTITQQVVKLVYGRPDGLLDKPREIARALQLEEEFDKDWILEQYLNRVPYGDEVVGVARASELYFGKPVSELTIGEAALLAGIPQAPTALDPRRHPEAASRRRAHVLTRMRETGRITDAQLAEALAEHPTIVSRPVRPWRAPRMADVALRLWREGRIPRERGAIRTSLDWPLQQETHQLLRAAVEEHRLRGVSNGAAVVLHNRTGQVIAYVGAARTGSDAPGGWLDLARARRQPGSTLKPFVYELLFERGGTAATVLDDLSRPMLGSDGVLFSARDYDGRERGPVRARPALASSLNLAALDASRRVRAERVVSRLRELGVAHLEDASHYGAAIVLGGADVSPLELADAYSTLARDGVQIPTRFSLGMPGEARRVMEAGAARVTRDILEDPRARRDAFGDDLTAEHTEGPFGLKTGTSSGWRDAWTAVFDETFTVVVWLGDPAGHPLGALSGFDGAARPAVRILAAAQRRRVGLGLDEVPESELAEEVTLATAQVCAATGHRAGERCTHVVDERFVVGTSPTEVCDAHGDDGRVVLPARYATWLRTEHPVGYALADAESLSGTPEIVHPRDGARLLVSPERGSFDIPLRATVSGSDASVSWEVDGEPIEGNRWEPTVGEHVLLAHLGSEVSQPVRVDVMVAR